jgi:hypothetical protein
MYIYLVDNKVQEFIPDYDPTFPGVSIGERYPSDFISRCVYISEGAPLPNEGDVYDPDSGMFYAPISAVTEHLFEPVSPEDIVSEFVSFGESIINSRESIRYERGKLTIPEAKAMSSYLESQGNPIHQSLDKQIKTTQEIIKQELSLSMGEHSELADDVFDILGIL